MKTFRELLEEYRGFLTIILIALAIVLAILWRTSSSKLTKNIADIAVLQNENKHLLANNDTLKKRIIAFEKAQDSLRDIIEAKKDEVVSLNNSYAKIAYKYATELARIREVPDDEAVGIFLDNADCGELPIIKYDSSYIIPICPIRMYNDLKVGYDMQTEAISLLQKKSRVQDGIIVNLEAMSASQNNEISSLKAINKNHEEIEGNLNKEISVWEKNYKIQRRKTIITGIAGGILVIGALLIK